MTTWEDNAETFRRLDTGEGWAFAALVACSVSAHAGGSYSRKKLAQNPTMKVSANMFAERADTSANRVMRYLEAWDIAAEQGLVPHSSTLTTADTHTVAEPTTAWLAKDGGVYSSGTTKAKRAQARTTTRDYHHDRTTLASRCSRIATSLQHTCDEAQDSTIAQTDAERAQHSLDVIITTATELRRLIRQQISDEAVAS